ncbi:WxcM-like domain-containing protein [Pseudomonas sp. MH2]|uniref:WxcM-like domain-containing protein n=1 Tax=Pseudomonas machongensis TaxID=3110229 RepID=A0ABU5V917_9PSED|nr:WxcM-like domain-containing protein [Pseudomonas sp. MH2]MEA5669849.1 WxcM-like domain-containing protein [Pseudomonas sp. MH2]
MSLVEFLDIQVRGDERGYLNVLEENGNVPFEVKRVYYLTSTKLGVSRGFHAHKELEQVAVCVSGQCRMLLSDGQTEESVLLDAPDKAVRIRKMIWHEMHDFSEDCVLLVLASDHYDEGDYIRNHDEFLRRASGVKIHPLADVHTDDIGHGSRIWQYVVVMSGARIGSDCNLCAHVLVEGDVVIGDRVTLKSGVFLWDGTRIEDDVFIGPNATFTNDPMPRSKVYPDAFQGIVVKQGASIGANATLLPGITIGKGAMVGAGAVVTKSVPDFAVVVGNPAKVIRTLSHD